MTDPTEHAAEPPSEEDMKTRALDAIADLISVAIQNANPGSFARAKVYSEAASLIERGPKQSREDLAVTIMPMVTEMVGKYFSSIEGPNKRSRLFEEMHQLVHTRELVSPSDKESLKVIDARLSEIAKALAPEQNASVISIAPEAAPAS
jgi:hypothetical protein